MDSSSNCSTQKFCIAERDRLEPLLREAQRLDTYFVNYELKQMSLKNICSFANASLDNQMDMISVLALFLVKNQAQNPFFNIFLRTDDFE